MSNCDVIVVGGGVIGCSCAYALARAGLAVELLEERYIAAEASWASAGMIDGHSLGRAADGEYVRLKARSAAMFAAMAAQLQSETGIDCEYHVTGKLELALNERQQKHLQRLADGAAAVWQDGDAIRRREPRLQAGVLGGLYFPQSAQIKPHRFTRALAAAATRHGAAIRCNSKVVAVDAKTTSVTLADGATRRAQWLVIANGAWAGKLLPLPIRPVRGQVELLRPGKPFLQHIVEHGERYLVPRRDGAVYLGATIEHVGFDRSTTDKGIQWLREGASCFVSGLDKLPVERRWAAVRPWCGLKRPMIGPMPQTKSVLLALGHYRSGITLAPVTGELISQYVLEQDRSVDWQSPPQEKALYNS